VAEEFDEDHQSSGSDSDENMADADSDAPGEEELVERPKKKQKTSKK
jgi:structure-specific recognition protein 1